LQMKNYEEVYNESLDKNQMVNEFLEGDQELLENQELMNYFNEIKGDLEFSEKLNEEMQKFNNINLQNILDPFYSIGKEFEEYAFNTENPFLNEKNNFDKGLELFKSGNLKDAILAFEAHLQGENSTDSIAWKSLGQMHSENYDDVKAIQALNRSLEIDPSDTEALILISVNHSNNNNIELVHQVLVQWLFQNQKFVEIAKSNPLNDNPYENHDTVIYMFMEAARISQDDIDVNVHLALGVLFNMNYKFNEASECFKTALKIRPLDYQLWNKLGATLANDNRNEEAIECYSRALEVNPSYTRARSNLGHAFTALNQIEQAANCYLGALTINNSPHFWINLKTCFALLGRDDLVELSGKEDPELFRPYFEF